MAKPFSLDQAATATEQGSDGSSCQSQLFPRVYSEWSRKTFRNEASGANARVSCPPPALTCATGTGRTRAAVGENARVVSIATRPNSESVRDRPNCSVLLSTESSNRIEIMEAAPAMTIGTNNYAKFVERNMTRKALYYGQPDHLVEPEGDWFLSRERKRVFLNQRPRELKQMKEFLTSTP